MRSRLPSGSGCGMKTDLTAIFPHHQGTPFSAGLFLKHRQSQLFGALSYIPALGVEDSRENYNPTRFQCALNLSQVFGDNVGRQVTKQESNGVARDGINRAAKQTNRLGGVSIQILARNLNRNRIKVSRVNRASTKKGCSYREDARPGAQIQHDSSGLHPDLHSFKRELRCFVGSCAEGLTGIDRQGEPIRRTLQVVPAGNNKEAPS